MKHRLLVLALAVLMPALVAGQSNQTYRCTNADMVRRVEIVYSAGASVPCEVHYYKDTETPGERRVLWEAANEAGYCEAQTRDFIAQLEGWGWSCADDAGTRAAPGAAADSDDTDTLEAGNDA